MIQEIADCGKYAIERIEGVKVYKLNCRVYPWCVLDR